MVKLFTVMYILCSVYATTPDISSPAFLGGITEAEAGMVSLGMQAVPDGSLPLPEAEQPEVGQPDVEQPEADTPLITDPFEELKTLGLYKDESKDAELNKRNAVIRFQSRCNMTITGEWDEKCLAALVKVVKAGTFEYADIVSTPPSDKEWFALNKTRRILTLYCKDKVICKYPVAVGSQSSVTPSGKFTIVSKVVNPTWGGGGYAKPVKGGSPDNPLGYRWMGLSYKNGSSVGIHGNNSPYSIGREVSHGCIRMINSDVESLFTITPMNSIVWIGTGKELEEWGVTQPEPAGDA